MRYIAAFGVRKAKNLPGGNDDFTARSRTPVPAYYRQTPGLGVVAPRLESPTPSFRVTRSVRSPDGVRPWLSGTRLPGPPPDLHTETAKKTALGDSTLDHP